MFFGTDAEKAERTKWLKSLKAGDLVAVEAASHYAGHTWTKATIAKITPTGRIKLEDLSQYNTDGELCTGEKWSRTRYTLVPWTDEIERTQARRKLEKAVRYYTEADHIDSDKVSAASDQELQELLTLLRKYRKEQPK
jgi:hypothetical protein